MGIREKLTKRGLNRKTGPVEREKNPFLKSAIFFVTMYAVGQFITYWVLWR